MSVVDLSISKKDELVNKSDMLGEKLRQEAQEFAKNFKTSWLSLGRHLYAIHQDKLYYGWGYNKFEDYTEKELGIKKSLCMKFLKAYLFLEEDEPAYLAQDFAEMRDPVRVPNYDQLDVLRMAKFKSEVLKNDYQKLRSGAFEHGKDAGEMRKELTAIMKERKQIDPDEERDQRNEAAIKKMLNSLKAFKKDMEVLKLVPDELVEEAESLMKKLENEVS